MNVREYGTAPRDALIAELVTQTDAIASAHVRLAGYIADHQRTYWKGYEQSDGASVSARQQDAHFAARVNWYEVLETRGEINAAAVKVDLLRLLLGSDLRSTQRDTFPPDKAITT